MTVVVTLAVLLVTAVGLGAVSATRGPRLESAEIDVTAAVSQPGQALVIETDHVLAPVAPADVVVTPAVPFRVSTEGPRLTVRFNAMLFYAADYAVRVATRSAGTGAASTLAFEFSTPEGQIFGLDRAGLDAPEGSDDIVLRRPLSSDDFEIAYQAPRIQEYAVADPLIAVVTSDPEGIGTLTVASLDGVSPARTVLDGIAMSQLRTSGPGGVFGFITSEQARGESRGANRLLLVDPAGPASSGPTPAESAPPRPVTGLDGRPLVVNNWRFVPGTRSVVVQTEDSSIFLIDPLGTGTVTPLGAHGVLHGFPAGSTSLVVETDNRFTAIDLATGKSAPVPQPPLSNGQQIYGISPVSDLDYVRLTGAVGADSTRFSVERTNGPRVEVIYRPDDPRTWVQTVCVSPNGQFVAIETSPPGAVVDDYAERPGFSATTTQFVELATKKVVAQMPGFLVDWCP